MKKILFIFLIPLIYFSCTRKNGPSDMETLKAKISQNKNFIELCTAQDQLALMSLNGESSFQGADLNTLRREIKNVKSLEEAKALNKKVGIKGGDKIATLMYQMDQNMKGLLKDMPELKSLDRKQLSELLKFKTSIGERDVLKSADSIINQDK